MRQPRTPRSRKIDMSPGTKYLLSRTFPPSLEPGPDDGSMATRWHYGYHEDQLERQPFNQIAGSAVRELQNIMSSPLLRGGFSPRVGDHVRLQSIAVISRELGAMPRMRCLHPNEAL
ncbi:hypothetical protein [Streptomyces sp. NPDC000410]|uniref:hypothetical protein n=1 Tax=Streptomyces sp. NPDC000410 TaxID=3154254 RepID=UPI0033283CC6